VVEYVCNDKSIRVINTGYLQGFKKRTAGDCLENLLLPVPSVVAPAVGQARGSGCVRTLKQGSSARLHTFINNQTYV
jgi:hypothetical protein